MPMSVSLPDELVDAVYQAALEPAAWGEVMRQMKQHFPSAAQTFYFLHIEPHRVQPVCLAGIEPQWLRTFDELYFAPDNPWIRLTQRLHRPGIVRTNERLDSLLRDEGVLYRSAYYNDWMRPQGFRYTMGNTLLSEDGIVANITLLRAPDMKSFDDAQVRSFESLSRHMTRALQMAKRLQCTEASPASIAAFEAMTLPVAVLNAQRHLLYANGPMEDLLRSKRGLLLRQGKLDTTDADCQAAFAAGIARALSGARAYGEANDPMVLPLQRPGHLTLHAMPIIGQLGRPLLSRPTVLLLATEHRPPQSVSRSVIARNYDCTRSEAWLAQLLAEGKTLRQAAQEMGVTYETARGYLKIVFDKVGVHTQAQLVARVLGDGVTTAGAR